MQSRKLKKTSPQVEVHDDDRVLPYIEFQSKLLQLTETVSSRNFTLKKAFNLLAESDDLFTDDGESELSLNFTWPHSEGNRNIQVISDMSDDGVSLSFYYRDKYFLSVTLDPTDGVMVEQPSSSAKIKEWTQEDIVELISNFNQVWRAKLITYKTKTKSIVEEISKDDNNYFTKAEFGSFIDAYQEYNLTYRIENVIIQHAKKRGQQYTFFLDWPDSLEKNHSLKVIFSRIDNFHEDYSWVASEETLLTICPDYARDQVAPNQRYYSLSVVELPAAKSAATTKEIEILSVWLAVDGLIGELRDLKKGNSLSGNDVLAIYSYFDQLFHVKQTFICDESKLAEKDDNIRIPLRLLSSLCTGQTWYQSRLPGVTLFECEKLQTAKNGVMTQHAASRTKALTELQKLRLSEWHKMLDANGKRKLLAIAHGEEQSAQATRRRSPRFIEEISPKTRQHDYGKKTIKELATTLFNEAKQARAITPGLAVFIELLCDDMHFDETIALDDTAPDFWVKSRVKELLWGSYFWVKQAEPEVMSAKQLK